MCRSAAIPANSAGADWQTGGQAVAEPGETRAEPTYRFNDGESGCHLSAALTATPGTENKQAEQMLILHARAERRLQHAQT